MLYLLKATIPQPQTPFEVGNYLRNMKPLMVNEK